MRVLAIRGHNLASLAGSFAVELESGPLGGTGLFAITGPTGAGKSTLLDAMCLALYNRVPRLSGQGPEVDGLSANDARTVVRRGASSGMAEVVFAGRDGRTWRARWGARRARMRADGAWQQATVELWDDDTGERKGGTLTETLAEIQSRIGLGYAEFRRSALLAQGDFAAFLRAQPAERAQLLERMTGTEIYARVSAAAWTRSEVADAALAGLEAEARAVVVLEDADRQALEEEERVRAAATELTKGELARAEAAARWHTESHRLSADADLAAEAEHEAALTYDVAAPLRLELAEVEAAEQLRAAVAGADVLAERAASTRAAMDALATSSREAATLAGNATSEAKAAQAGLAEVEACAEARDRELAHARGLNHQVDAAGAEAARATAAAVEASAALVDAEAQVSELEQAHSALVDVEGRAWRWLDEREAWASMVGQWDRWGTDLDRFDGADGALRLALTRSDEVHRASDAAGKQREAAARALEAAKEVFDAAESTCAVALAAVPPPPSDPAARRGEWLTTRDRCTEALRALDECERLTASVARAEADAEHARCAAEAAGIEADDARTGARALDARVDDADRSQRLAHAALDLEARRAELQEGDPCPLCGSETHPWAAASPLAHLAGALADEHRALLAARHAQAVREAGARTRAESEDKRALEARERAESGGAEALALAARWPDLALGDPDTRTELEVARHSAHAEILAIDAEEQRWREATETAVAARLGLDREAVVVRTCEDALRTAELGVAAADRDVEAWAVSLDGLQATRDRALDVLGKPFGHLDGWRAALTADAGEFRAARAEEVDAWNTRTREHAEAHEGATRLGPGVAGARVGRDLARDAAAEAEARRGERGAALTAARSARQLVLDGRPTAEVEGEVRTAKARAAERARVALDHARLAEAESGRAAGMVAQAEEAHRSASEGQVRAQATLIEALGGVSEGDVRARLLHGPKWVTQRRAHLEALRRARDEAHIRTEERRGAFLRHRDAPDASVVSPDEAANDEARARTEAERAASMLTEARVALRTDDQARARFQELQPRLESGRAEAGRWGALNAVIGSRNGDKFRKYAQSLTLDLLVDEANRHLRELSPRYRVERVPGHDLDLQVVDHDFADEIRAVQSLSGGESFLVSLALALGLASLAANDTRVESLFIDEGLGTLDPHTLDIALGALETLEATGKKIGLISHVPGLEGRFGAHVEVIPTGAGRSRVVTVAA